jgi:hypothetical protein
MLSNAKITFSDWYRGHVVCRHKHSIQSSASCKVTRSASRRTSFACAPSTSTRCLGSSKDPPGSGRNPGVPEEGSGMFCHMPSRVSGAQRSLAVQGRLTRNRTSVVHRLVKTHFADSGDEDSDCCGGGGRRVKGSARGHSGNGGSCTGSIFKGSACGHSSNGVDSSRRGSDDGGSSLSRSRRHGSPVVWIALCSQWLLFTPILRC